MTLSETSGEPSTWPGDIITRRLTILFDTEPKKKKIQFFSVPLHTYELTFWRFTGTSQYILFSGYSPSSWNSYTKDFRKKMGPGPLIKIRSCKRTLQINNRSYLFACQDENTASFWEEVVGERTVIRSAISETINTPIKCDVVCTVHHIAVC